MKTILLTGSNGFIGKNLFAHLSRYENINLLSFDSNNTTKELEAFLLKADFIFHLAGVNRPKDENEFDIGNRGLTEDIVAFLEDNNKKTPILMSSSIQAELDNPYGKSKKAAEKAIFEYSRRTKAPVYIYRLPNVFGKWCKPNYNSAVATFCHNIANNLPITISDPKNQLTLVYIDDVVADFIKAFHGKKTIQNDGYCYIQRSFKITLGKLANTINSFKNSRESLVMPDFKNNLVRFLYATYISYLKDDNFCYQLTANSDNRGWLAEFIKSKNFGQIFVSKTKPGITRGNHWHHTKIEKFLVVDGLAEISFRAINDQKKIIKYTVSGDKLTVVDIPVGYTHSIKNVGDKDLSTIFWSDEIFNKRKPDTYYEEV